MSVNGALSAQRYPILLVLDANVLVAELLKQRGRRLLADPRLQLTITESAWSETIYELRKRGSVLAAHNQPLADTVEEAITFAGGLVERIPDTQYRDLLSEAARRIPDADDVSTVALALAINAAIWTADEHFWGGGLPVWRTERLLAYLG